jgi:hypothetical protein
MTGVSIATPDKGDTQTMAVIIPFPKPKQEPMPEWRQVLMKLFWDEGNWRVFPDGSKRLALIPRGRYVSVVAMSFTLIGGDDNDAEAIGAAMRFGETALWWSFSLHGGEHLDDVWEERADAEQAAWEALLRVEERRRIKLTKRRR